MFGRTCRRYFIFYQFTLLFEIAAGENCTDGLYYRSDIDTCLPCSSCDAFSMQLKPCTSQSDTVCVTCAGEYKQKHPECYRCRPCRSGHFLTSPCTPTTANVCKKCWRGSYSAKPSYSTHCLRCLDCKRLNRKEVRSCKSHRDAVCGRCKRGFYKVSSLEKCLPCQSCSPGRQKIKACHKSRGGKSCGVFIMKPNIRRVENVSTYTQISNSTTTPEDFEETTEPVAKHNFVSSITFICILPVFIIMLIMMIIMISCKRRNTKGLGKFENLDFCTDQSEITIDKKCNVQLPYNSEVTLCPNQRFICGVVISVSQNLDSKQHAHKTIQQSNSCPGSTQTGFLTLESMASKLQFALLNGSQTSKSYDTQSLSSAPEPTQPPPPPPLKTAVFYPPELPLRQTQFMTL